MSLAEGVLLPLLKQLTPDAQKGEKTVNTGQVMLVEKSIITDPLIQVRKLTNSLVKHR